MRRGYSSGGLIATLAPDDVAENHTIGAMLRKRTSENDLGLS